MAKSCRNHKGAILKSCVYSWLAKLLLYRFDVDIITSTMCTFTYCFFERLTRMLMLIICFVVFVVYYFLHVGLHVCLFVVWTDHVFVFGPTTFWFLGQVNWYSRKDGIDVCLYFFVFTYFTLSQPTVCFLCPGAGTDLILTCTHFCTLLNEERFTKLQFGFTTRMCYKMNRWDSWRLSSTVTHSSILPTYFGYTFS